MPDRRATDIPAVKADAADVQALRDEVEAFRLSLSANTQLTAEVKTQIADLRSATQPIVDAMKTMEAGIRTIGRIGTLGAKLGKFVLLLIACWGAFKLLAVGASWAEISTAFMRSIGK